MTPLWLNSDFNKKCQTHGIEAVPSEEGIRFVCPKIPAKSVQEDLVKELPAEMKYKWVEDLKKSTISTLDMVFTQLKSSSLLKGATLKRPSPHRFRIDFEANERLAEQVEQFFAKDGKAIAHIEEILQKDGYPEYYEISLDGKEITTYSRIGQVARAQVTDHGVITDSDVIDLRIVLGTCDTVEDFLKQVS